jgi:hypothetical protein
MTLNGTVGDELERTYRHLPGGTEENHNETSVRITGVPAKVRTENLPNISIASRSVFLMLILLILENNIMENLVKVYH